MRTTISSPSSTSRSKGVVTEIPVGVEPEGMGISPDGKTMVNTSETTNMAHFIDTSTHEIIEQRAGRFAPALRRVHAGRQGGLGQCRDRRHGVGDRQCDARGQEQDHLRDSPACAPNRSSRSACASPPTARRPMWRWGRPTASRWSTPRPTRSRNTFWSASASGSWLSRRTRRQIISTNGVSNDITFIDVATDEPMQSVTVGALPWGVVVSPK